MKRLILAICLLALLGSTACPAPESADKDPRLDQKVAIKAIGKPLGEFLAVVSDATGVKMTARKGSADLKVCMYVKDLPLSGLQEALKTVLHLQCTREGKKGEWSYEFWEDARTRQEIDSLKQAEVKKLKETTQKLFEDLKLSPDELLKKYRHAEAIPYSLTNSEQHTILEILAADRSHLETMWQGQPLLVDARSISADMLEKLRRALNESEEKSKQDLARYRAEHPEEFKDQQPVRSEVETQWGSVKNIEFEVKESEYNSGMCLTVTANGQMQPVDPQNVPEGEDCSGPTSYEFSIEPTEFDTSESLANFLDENPDARKEMAEAESKQDDSQSGETGDDTAEQDPPDNIPTVKITLDKPSSSYRMLVLIAEQLKSSFVSDYFTFLAQPTWDESEGPIEFPATSLADMLGMLMEADAVQEDDLYLITSKTWYRNRERELPDRLVKQWRDVIEKQGYLGLKEVLEISALTDAQIANLAAYDLPSAYEIQWQRKLLQLIAGFSSDQWTAAMSEEGLQASSLSQQQHQLLSSYLATGDMNAFSWLLETGRNTPPDQPAPEIRNIRLTSAEQDLAEAAHKIQVWTLVMKTQYAAGEAQLPILYGSDSEEEQTTPSDADGIVEISVPGKQ